jgi:hypothetical protein
MRLDLEAAMPAGQQESETEVRARSVRYLPDQDCIELVTNRQGGFLIPRQWIDALLDIPVAELGNLAVWPDGSAIEIDDLDVHISVDGLMSAVLPRMLPARAIAALFASRGGKATSEAKRSSARRNGLKGGRPHRGKAASA